MQGNRCLSSPLFSSLSPPLSLSLYFVLMCSQVLASPGTRQYRSFNFCLRLLPSDFLVPLPLSGPEMGKTWTESSYEASFDVSPSPFSSIGDFSRFTSESLHLSPGPVVNAETFASGKVMLLDEGKRPQVLMVYAEMQVRISQTKR